MTVEGLGGIAGTQRTKYAFYTGILMILKIY